MSTSIMPVEDHDQLRSALCVQEPFKAHEERLLGIVSQSKALLQGHFQLGDGRHGDLYLRFNNFARYSEDVEFAAQILVNELDRFGDIDTIVNLDGAGIMLAYDVAKKLGLPRVTAATDKTGVAHDLINYLDLKRGARVLLINDELLPAQRRQALERVVERYGATVVGCAALLSRESYHCNTDGRDLAVFELQTAKRDFTAQECPYCAGPDRGDAVSVQLLN